MEFDGFVETFVKEHVLFTEALKGILLSSVMSGSLTPAGLTDLEAKAYRAAKTHYTRATRDLESFTNDLITDDGSEPLELSLRHRNREVMFAVRVTVLASIKAITSAAKGNALTQPQNITQVADFVRGPDGRNWRAEKLIRTIVRDFAYQSHTDKAIDEIMMNGGSSVVIKYDVPGEREFEDAVLTVEDFAALRSKIFHINASAKVEANV